MKTAHRIGLIVLGVLLVLTSAGLVMTSNWGSRKVSLSKRESATEQSPVDLEQLQTAQALAPFAATSEEQEHARDAIRMADHEVDFAFAAALYQAASQTVVSTPEIKAILDRISKAEQSVATLDADAARLTKLIAGAKGNQKDDLSQQLDLTKARLELNEDELADANQDLERAGGDPKSRIQRMVDQHSAMDNGQPDTNMIGRQAASTKAAANSFLSRTRAWFELRSIVARLGEAGQEATRKADSFSTQHDALEHQLEEAQSKQTKKLAGSTPGAAPGGSPAAASGASPDERSAAITAYHSLTALQKRMSGLDSRIQNQQDLAKTYGQWELLAATRERGLLHSVFISLAWMVAIALAVVVTDFFFDQLFDRLEPDRKNLLTLRAVAQISTRALGAILILLVIFGPPGQMATVLALAGAGLTVALKDFIVGFFGWFVLMGKNGIRHGDWVEINGVSGEVVEIGLFHTVLLETGNWNDSGHPTGRRVTFVNSYAIEGHYFNFSTSGQWLWDELEVVLPVDQDPYPVVEEIKKIVEKETEANAHLAEQEWEKMGSARGVRPFSAGPAISVRPANLGFEIMVRYVTRANERHQQRSKLYNDIVELLRQKNIPEPAAPAAQ